MGVSTGIIQLEEFHQHLEWRIIILLFRDWFTIHPLVMYDPSEDIWNIINNDPFLIQSCFDPPVVLIHFHEISAMKMPDDPPLG